MHVVETRIYNKKKSLVWNRVQRRCKRKRGITKDQLDQEEMLTMHILKRLRRNE